MLSATNTTNQRHHNRAFEMEKLDGILDACVTKGDKTTKDELLGLAFVVVDKDGEASFASCLPSSGPP